MSFLSSIYDLLYPRICVCCGKIVDDNTGFVCWDCRSGFKVITAPYCSVCGDPVDGKIENVYECSNCRHNTPYFDCARSAVRYIGTVKEVIHQFKYRKQACLAQDLVKWLIAGYNVNYANFDIDAVIAVPLYVRRERERTYNQSALLANLLAKELKLEAYTKCVKRIRDTGSQVSLNSRQRRINIRHAFAVNDAAWVTGKKLLLIDDVMTTGSTVNEIARVLKKDASADAVYVLTVARG